jgi:hypothetical protein
MTRGQSRIKLPSGTRFLAGGEIYFAGAELRQVNMWLLKGQFSGFKLHTPDLTLRGLDTKTLSGLF